MWEIENVDIHDSAPEKGSRNKPPRIHITKPHWCVMLIWKCTCGKYEQEKSGVGTHHLVVWNSKVDRRKRNDNNMDRR